MLALKPDKPTYKLVNITLEATDIKIIRKAYKIPLASNYLIIRSAIKDFARILELTKKHPAELVEMFEKQLEIEDNNEQVA